MKEARARYNTVDKVSTVDTFGFRSVPCRKLNFEILLGRILSGNRRITGDILKCFPIDPREKSIQEGIERNELARKRYEDKWHTSSSGVRWHEDDVQRREAKFESGPYYTNRIGE